MNHVKRLAIAGLSLALALLLPFLTGQIPQFGNMLSPMHIPVLLCGFICGWKYGLLVGVVAPALRYLLFGMPPLFPTGLAMTFELASYGLLAGLLYHRLPKKPANIYISLLGAMIGGRIIWGIAMWLIAMFAVDVSFGFAAFAAGAFLNAIPGIILHLFLIPIIIIALKKAGYIYNE